jgi:Ser/Thr protein kinase RdoA (MazF antagonist)
MIVELAGPIGAGKSSLAKGLPEALRTRGVAASHLDDIARFDRPQTWLWNARFAAAYPQLVWAAWRALARAPLPWWHRRLIFGLVLGVGGRIEYARRLVPPHHVVLVDEGLVHRAVNLFGWYDSPPTEAVRGYISLVPLPDALVAVDADPDAARQRAIARGLPKRLTGRSQEDVDAFVARARDVAGIARAAVVARPDATVIKVKNGRSLRRSVSDVARPISRLVKLPVGNTDLEFRPTAPMVLRPDRAAARISIRGARTIPRQQLQRALEQYGLHAIGRSRTLSAPGARGAAVQVVTPQGEVVVKRYKQALDSSALPIEHAVLKALAASDVPVPNLRQALDGGTSVSVDGSRFSVSDAIRGYRHPHELVMARADRHSLEAIAGRLLARLHTTLADVQVPSSETLGFLKRGGPRVREVDWFADRLASAPAPRRVRAWAIAALWQLREAFDAHSLPITVIHGDYAPYNLLVRAGNVPVIVDFELARLDWRLVDLATGVGWFSRRRWGFDIGAARRLIDAYHQTSDASGEELAMIPAMAAFLALQRAAVTWSRAESEPGVAWDLEAKRRIVIAEDLLAGRDPLNAAVKPW